MKRFLIAAVLLGTALVTSAHAEYLPSVRARVYAPTCRDLAFKVQVENYTTHTIRIQAVWWNPKREVKTFRVLPGWMVGVRLPVHFVGAQRGFTINVVRFSWAHFKATGKGLLADGHRYFPNRCGR